MAYQIFDSINDATHMKRVWETKLVSLPFQMKKDSGIEQLLRKWRQQYCSSDSLKWSEIV